MFVAWICSALVSATVLAKGPLVLDGRPSADTRLGPLRGERGDFLFRPASTPARWRSRADQVRRIMRVTMGLWPLPTRTPLNAVIHGRIEQDDYTIDKVYFESVPGFFVTGNLYRPKGKPGRLPAVLSPHGHFPGGRFIDEGLDAVRKKIEAGAEQHEDGGRSFMQSRCVLLARMGCVVFHYDMIGYGDCEQIPLDVGHKFSRSRMKLKEPPKSGLYSASALLNCQNSLGLHTWNSIRALDFLESLPDVDPSRIAVTGGSGGGTQTFMLCAVDDRPLVSVPVVIVSADRQGGCVCENICGLRIGTTNLEFNALHEPKPLLMISADDASRTMPERGFPEMKQHYKSQGAAGKVELKAFLQFPHNYNLVSRQAMAHFVNRHLQMNLAEPIVERPFKRLSKEELTVWNEDHPRPDGGPEFERQLLDTLAEDARQKIKKLEPHDAPSLKKYREIVGGGWDVLLSRPRDTEGVSRKSARIGGPQENPTRISGIYRYRTYEKHTAEVPMVLLQPDGRSGRLVIWVSDSGKGDLFRKDGSINPIVKKLCDHENPVVGLDLLGQGENVLDGKPLTRQRSLPGEDAFGGWTYCYNMPLFARRVQDIVSVIETAFWPGLSIDIIGTGRMGPVVAAAVAQTNGKVCRAAIDTGGFRFGSVTDIYDAEFLPGAARYGDLPGLLSLAAPTKLWLAGEGKTPPKIIRAAYDAAGAGNNLTVFSGKDVESEAVDWLLKKKEE
jgi:hypothetical protein